jgi:hypothetical protein
MAAYSTAFRILPSVHRGYERGAFERLRNLLLLSTDAIIGWAEPDSAVFYARPAVVADSLVLVPYPWKVMFAGDSSSIPRGFEQALARQRAEFRRIAAGWSAAYPQSPGAKYAVAISLDLLGDPASIDTIRLARRLEKDPSRQLRLASAEVILLTKFGAPDDLSRLRAARLLSDSLLSRSPPYSVGDAGALAPVAALSGHCAQTDALSHDLVPAVGWGRISARLMGDANALVSRIAMGCRLRDVTMRSVSVEIERTFANAKADQHRRVEQMLLYRPVILDYGADSSVTEQISASTEDKLLIAARAALHRDKVRAGAALTAVERRVDPGVPTPDISLARSRLWVSIGEKSRAIRTLDTALEGIRKYDAETLAQPENGAALVSAMILRAQLASESSDYATARRWAGAVGVLWSTADEDLKPALNTMDQYARAR